MNVKLERNLCTYPGVRIAVSVTDPTGSSNCDPQILLNDTAHQLHGHPLADFDPSHTYDTYDGQNLAQSPDWYRLIFPEPVVLNCVEMTMGIAYVNGGWWTSLNVEYRADESSEWQSVQNLSIDPNYEFRDVRGGRRPFETYVLMFSELTCRELRLIGRSGGSSQFTCLSRIAAYRRDLARWHPSELHHTPMPYVFQLVSPEVIWDLSENLAMLCELTISFGIMQVFLDDERFNQYMQRVSHNYQGLPDLWFLLGETIGWKDWNTLTQEPPRSGIAPSTPYVFTCLNGLLGRAVAPVVVHGEVIGSIETQFVVIKNGFDEVWHQNFAREYEIQWETYLNSIERSVQMTTEQLRGAAGLMKTIANTLANLGHRNQMLQHQLNSAKRSRKERAAYQKEIVLQAMDYMRDNLEARIRVPDVAQAVSLSVPHLNRMFAEQLGCTPGAYLIDLRLERAKAYLLERKMSVMDICVALNYDPSYFSRLFKNRVGCTPGQFALRTSHGQ